MLDEELCECVVCLSKRARGKSGNWIDKIPSGAKRCCQPKINPRAANTRNTHACTLAMGRVPGTKAFQLISNSLQKTQSRRFALTEQGASKNHENHTFVQVQPVSRSRSGQVNQRSNTAFPCSSSTVLRGRGERLATGQRTLPSLPLEMSQDVRSSRQQIPILHYPSRSICSWTRLA